MAALFSKNERSPWKLALFGGLLVLLTFLPTLRNGPVWDDHDLVVGNPFFRSWSGILDLFRNDIWTTTRLGVRSEFYRPLPMVSFAVDHFLGNDRVPVYHLGNALFHALAAFVLALALHRALRGGSRFLPIVCAMAWGLSPIGTEPVAWISGRFDVLAALFTLLALLANFGESKKHQALTVVAIAASLLCKEAAILGPVVLALGDLLMLGRSPRKLFPKYLVLALVVFANIALRSSVGVVTAQARPEIFELARSYAFMVTGVLGRTVFPQGLDAFHPYVAPSLSVTFFVLLGAFLVFAALLFASFRAREPYRYRVALFGCLWFCLMLAPAALTGPALDMVGDRYAYLPNIGLAFASAALVLELRDRLSRSFSARQVAIVGIGLAALTLVASALGSVRRLADWRDDRSLIEASLRANPGNPYALYALGEREVIAGHYERGDGLLRKSIETGPRPWRAQNALCYSLLNQKRFEEAEKHCLASLSINGQDPRTWINLASIRVRQKRWQEALDFAHRGRKYRARYAESHYLAAVSLANLGRLDEAIAELRQSLLLDPDHKAARSLEGQFKKRGVVTL